MDAKAWRHDEVVKVSHVVLVDLTRCVQSRGECRCKYLCDTS